MTAPLLSAKSSGAHAGKALNLGVLDALRGLAALYVMLGHASGLLWAGMQDPASTGQSRQGESLGYLAHQSLPWPPEAVRGGIAALPSWLEACSPAGPPGPG